MVAVEVKPEANTSARRIPREALRAYAAIFGEWESTARLKLPGPYLAHPLRNAKNLWTLKLTEERGHPWVDYRCIYQWDGSEIAILRFGHWRSIYEHLPKNVRR